MDKEIISAIIPGPDSHFRLVPCGCGSDKVAYEQYRKENAHLWRVRCSACGYVVDKGCTARHDAQVAWNERKK